MAKQLTVLKAKVSKGLLGAWKIEFACPECKAPLNAKEATIGKVDDCQLCGAEFLISPRIRQQIDEIEAETANEEEQAAQRKQEAEAERRKERRNADLARREEMAEKSRERQEEVDSQGYDYPNLRKYQKSLERTAIIGAALWCLLGGVLLILAIASLTRNFDGIIIAMSLFSALSCFGAAASWYFWWMVVAEMIRLTVTVALDVRVIRDAYRTNSGDA
jgi:uncharacterized Zn finger protein (UPF0148 family)